MVSIRDWLEEEDLMTPYMTNYNQENAQNDYTLDVLYNRAQLKKSRITM